MSPRKENDPDSSSEDEAGLGWLLGFVEPPLRKTDLLRHRFPSKVGGRPAWLDPLHLPTPDQLVCPISRKHLSFLLQVYAPVDDKDASFHRAIFVFVSPQGDSLAQPGAVKAFRCQLPRANPYYPPEPLPKSQDQPPRMTEESTALALSRDPWKVEAAYGDGFTMESGEELGVLDGAGNTSDLPLLFPESELVVEPEQEGAATQSQPYRTAASEKKLQSLLAQYKAHIVDEGELDEEELPESVMDSIEEAVTAEQKHFASFAARISQEPGQCLRYCFQPNAVPIWPSSKNIPSPTDIPECPKCGSPRHFEFQVMPQLINYLGADPLDATAPDWGMIAVYTCSESCGSGFVPVQSDDSAYSEEFVWVQQQQQQQQ